MSDGSRHNTPCLLAAFHPDDMLVLGPPQVATRAVAEAARQTQAANEAFSRIRGDFDAVMTDMASTLQQLVGC